MHPKDEKFIHYWKKRSEAGRTSFTITTVVFAIVLAMLIELGHLLFPDTTFTLRSLLTRIVIMAVFGFFWGRWYWSSNDKRYQELLKQKEK